MMEVILVMSTMCLFFCETCEGIESKDKQLKTQQQSKTKQNKTKHMMVSAHRLQPSATMITFIYTKMESMIKHNP